MLLLNTNRMTTLLVLLLLKELQWGFGLYCQWSGCREEVGFINKKLVVSLDSVLQHKNFWELPMKNMLVEKVEVSPKSLRVWGQSVKGVKLPLKDSKQWVIKWKHQGHYNKFIAEKLL